MQNPKHPNITGTAINYLYVCQRKLWLHQHHINMEHTSEAVDLGKHLHEQSYPPSNRTSMELKRNSRCYDTQHIGLLIEPVWN